MFLLGLSVVMIYCLPLFGNPLYISVFDILDSTVPLLKILAHSEKIFTDNNDIIPNMMHGLPRFTYGSEYNVMLWLYYFFTPKTAYIINQFFIHIIAYISMFIFSFRYLSIKHKYNLLAILAGSLYFALLPFFSPAGLTISLLPLVTYSLLNIKNHIDNKWDWILLAVVPLYSSFVLLYIFYIMMAGLYLVWISIRNKHLHIRLLLGLILLSAGFILVEYRLFISMFFTSNFISHRTEFDIFFKYPLLDAFRAGHVFFLNGHSQHLLSLQLPYIIPLVLIAMLFSISKRKFSKNESMLILILLILSFTIDIWTPILASIYTLPLLAIYTLIIFLINKESRMLSLLFLWQLSLGVFVFITYYDQYHFLTEHFHILKEFNIARLTFIQPFIWAILVILSLSVLFFRLHYIFWFTLLFIFLQTVISFQSKEFYSTPHKGYATFENYYAPNLFKQLQQKINQPLNSYRTVSFGLEPAISLYNGFYTIDGYTTNYNLSYKHKFRKIIEPYLNKINDDNNFDTWGSKLYLGGIPTAIDKYHKGVIARFSPFNHDALCQLDTDYFISTYQIDTKKIHGLKLITSLKQAKKDSWDIYLYKVICEKKAQQN